MNETETAKNLSTSTSPKRLKAANPLDWVRLLCWMLRTPAVLKAHQRVYGETAHKPTAMWLVSTLSWTPLFLIVFAAMLDSKLIVDFTVFSTLPPLVWCGIILIGWGLTAHFRTSYSRMMRVVMGIGAFVVVGGGLFVVVVGITGGMVSGVALMVMLSVALGIAIVVTGFIAGAIAVFIAGGIVGAVAGVVMVVIAVTIESRIKSVESSPLVLIALGLAYSFLIWVYFLGGATVLGYVKA